MGGHCVVTFFRGITCITKFRFPAQTRGQFHNPYSSTPPITDVYWGCLYCPCPRHRHSENKIRALCIAAGLETMVSLDDLTAVNVRRSTRNRPFSLILFSGNRMSDHHRLRSERNEVPGCLGVWKTLRIGKDCIRFMVVVSHFKGHEVAGFCGALKNFGMGCTAGEGKREKHSTRPLLKKDACITCCAYLYQCMPRVINQPLGK